MAVVGHADRSESARGAEQRRAQPRHIVRFGPFLPDAGVVGGGRARGGADRGGPRVPAGWLWLHPDPGRGMRRAGARLRARGPIPGAAAGRGSRLRPRGGGVRSDLRHGRGGGGARARRARRGCRPGRAGQHHRPARGRGRRGELGGAAGGPAAAARAPLRARRNRGGPHPRAGAPGSGVRALYGVGAARPAAARGGPLRIRMGRAGVDGGHGGFRRRRIRGAPRGGIREPARRVARGGGARAPPPAGLPRAPHHRAAHRAHRKCGERPASGRRPGLQPRVCATWRRWPWSLARRAPAVPTPRRFSHGTGRRGAPITAWQGF